jgi:hypothetical protein
MTEYRRKMEEVLDEHFPKGKCENRSSGLMLYSAFVLQYESTMRQVKKHMSYLLGECREKGLGEQEYREAEEYYEKLRKGQE